jgi:DNA-binding Lrp family transcriptional regulator
MIAEERWTRIVEIVNENGVQSIVQLMDKLDASESTIRRDLIHLDEVVRLLAELKVPDPAAMMRQLMQLRGGLDDE